MPDTPGNGGKRSVRFPQLRAHAERVRTAERVAAEAPTTEKQAELAEMVGRLDRLEVFAEQAGRQAQLVESVNDYVRSLKAEVDALYGIRICAIIFAGLFCLALCGGAAAAFICQPGWLTEPRNHAVPAVLVASVGASVALIAVVLKGVFRAIADRNKDELLPEHLKVAMETVKTFSETMAK